jgi:uncharacterized protein
MLGSDRRTMTRAEAEAAQIDVGLRQHMLQVYNYMASGVALTGIVAYAASHTPALMQAIFGTPLQWVVMLAPLAFVMVLSFGINRLSLFTSQLLFWLFAGVMGLSLSSIFLIYTGESIARVFFITAASFSALSLYGYTTKRDLGPMRSFLVMGLIGIIIASVVNMFMQSSAMQFVISVVGVLVFAGLTAYDTQRIKLMYMESDSHETTGKKAIMGALTLYLDFINLMIMLLHLFGNRR